MYDDTAQRVKRNYNIKMLIDKDLLLCTFKPQWVTIKVKYTTKLLIKTKECTLSEIKFSLERLKNPEQIYQNEKPKLHVRKF